MAATASRGVVGDLARAITGDTGDGTQSLANAMSSVIAGGAGAVGGLVAGGGNSGLNALNGAAAASALEQYNAQEHMTVYGHRKKSGVPVSKETVHTIFDILSATPIPVVDTVASLVLVGMDVYDGNYGEAALDGLGLIPVAGAAVKDVVVARKAAKFAEKVEKANELRKEEEQARDAEKAANASKKAQHTPANDNTPPDGDPAGPSSSSSKEHQAEQPQAANDNMPQPANDNDVIADANEESEAMVVNGSRGSGSQRGSISGRGRTSSHSSSNGSTNQRKDMSTGDKVPDNQPKSAQNDSPPGAGRRGAFRQAKRDYGIPVSEQPTMVRPNLDRNDVLQPGRQYQFGPDENPKIIREDIAGHYHADAPETSIGPHFNLGDAKDSVVKPLKEGHYIYDHFSKEMYDALMRQRWPGSR